MTGTISHQLCQGLIGQGVEHLFCLPGVQNDDFFNTLVDFPALKPIVTRHEQACSYMATGAALATGRAQAYCTVPGQGLLNAASGHSTAFATSAPVFALVGQNKTPFIGQMHGLLHEIPDQMAVLGQISKHHVALRDAAAAPAQVAEAFRQLASGAPKPVTVECPLDLWIAEGGSGDAGPPERPALDTDAIDRAATLLAAAERPLIVLGGGAHGVPEALSELADMLQAPVSALRQGKGAYDETRPLAVFGPVAYQLWKSVDVVLAIGTRLMWHEMVWGTDDAMKIVQINADPEELNRRGNVDVAIGALAEDAVPALIAALGPKLGRRTGRLDEIAEMKARHEAEIARMQPTHADLMAIRDVLGPEGIFVADLTQISYPASYMYPVSRPRGFVSPGYAGTLGWGVPAGIGAALACPDRRVLVTQGDGGFLYGATELATAVKYGVNAVFLVHADGAYGNVKRIQEDRFGHNRTIASDLVNPDIVAFAESFGCRALRAPPGQLGPALETAFAQGGPCVIEVPVVTRYPDPWPLIIMPAARGGPRPPLLMNN